MSITIDDLGKAEDFSQQLEDMGLLAAYHHVLQAIAARRVSIPESHLYEFAAREFERYGQRRKGGMINLKQEEYYRLFCTIYLKNMIDKLQKSSNSSII